MSQFLSVQKKIFFFLFYSKEFKITFKNGQCRIYLLVDIKFQSIFLPLKMRNEFRIFNWITELKKTTKA